MTDVDIRTTDPEAKLKAKRTLLWFGIISIIMLFAGLTSAYIVRMGEGKWAQFPLPNTFIVSTLIILLSSLPMQWAVTSIRKGNSRNLVNGLIITFILGLGFVFAQYMAWSELFARGIVFAGKIGDIKTGFDYLPAGKETVAQAADAGNVAASFLYAITALHILHLAGGILALIIVLSHAIRKKYSPANYNGVRMCALYWHFLGGLWVYLFFFLFYVR